MPMYVLHQRWTVEAVDSVAAATNLPPFLAGRCEVVQVSEVPAP